MEADEQAIVVWYICANGMGGIDWGAVPFACEYLGISDVEMLVERLLVIKAYKPPKDADANSETYD